MKHIFALTLAFVIVSLTAIPLSRAGDADTFVEITEDAGDVSGIDINGNPISGTIEQTSLISCSEVKKRADRYENITQRLQTDDRRYGAMYRKMEMYKRLYSRECR
jgi:uncharacterized protein YqgV (UPF0045/DUF77 family)